MKKHFSKVMLVLIGIMALTMPVMAATIVSFSPANINAVQGQTFNLAIAVNPQNMSNYTVKVELNYPADLLEVKSFSFGNGWMPITQQGYDSIDNINGILVKTAGYPGGISSSITFGTVSFYAKKAGSGTIEIGNNSLALDINSQNVLSGSPKASFTVTVPVSAVSEKQIEEKIAVPIPAPTDKTQFSESEEAILSEKAASPQEEMFQEQSISMLAAISMVWGGSAQLAVIGLIVIFSVGVLLFLGIKEWKLSKRD